MTRCSSKLVSDKLFSKENTAITGCIPSNLCLVCFSSVFISLFFLEVASSASNYKHPAAVSPPLAKKVTFGWYCSPKLPAVDPSHPETPGPPSSGAVAYLGLPLLSPSWLSPVRSLLSRRRCTPSSVSRRSQSWNSLRQSTQRLADDFSRESDFFFTFFKIKSEL